MPIRINLLAEQQAAEELRRRDPVKRATVYATYFIGALLVWSGYKQVTLMSVKMDVNRLEDEWRQIEPDDRGVVTNVNRIAEANRKMEALQSLATNRFLWAPVFNALQFSLVDDVHIVRLKADQTYALTEGIKPSTNAAGIVSRGKPPTSREKILFTIEARDFAANPGDQIFKFQETINNQAFFKANLQKLELAGRSPAQTDPTVGARPYVPFTLECKFPEKVR